MVVESPTNKLDGNLPHIFPVCAVTRSQKHSNDNYSAKIVLPDQLTSQELSSDNLIEA